MRKWSLGLCAFLLTMAFLSQYGLTVSEAEPQVQEEWPTLENQVILTGRAEPETEILCSVYAFEEDAQTTLLYQTSDVVGASGLYQLTVPLPILGRQYVMLQVGTQETTYAYTRYRKQAAKELQEYYLNVYQVLMEMK